MRDFRELKVWEKGHQLTLAAYRITSGFPKQEMFGLLAKFADARPSIPANIAEGCGRLGNAELHRFLQIACGSANELEYHFLLARDLGYLLAPHYDSVHKDVLDLKRMLVSLTRKVGAERKG